MTNFLLVFPRGIVNRYSSDTANCLTTILVQSLMDLELVHGETPSIEEEGDS